MSGSFQWYHDIPKNGSCVCAKFKKMDSRVQNFTYGAVLSNLMIYIGCVWQVIKLRLLLIPWLEAWSYKSKTSASVPECVMDKTIWFMWDSHTILLLSKIFQLTFQSRRLGPLRRRLTEFDSQTRSASISKNTCPRSRKLDFCGNTASSWNTGICLEMRSNSTWW